MCYCMYPSLAFEFSFISFFDFFLISCPFLFILVFLLCLETTFLSVFLAISPDVVEASSNLASDAAGVAGHTAPELLMLEYQHLFWPQQMLVKLWRHIPK
jgi:hypothetical protein